MGKIDLVKVQSQLLFGDVRDGYAAGVRVHSYELEVLTGVNASQIAQMAKEIMVIERMGA